VAHGEAAGVGAVIRRGRQHRVPHLRLQVRRRRRCCRDDTVPRVKPLVLTCVMHGSCSQHPYIAWMVAPSTTRKQFLVSQMPFRFAVERFSQPIAAVVSKIPTAAARMSVFENLAEEHGGGDLSKAHVATFAEFLRALGATDEEIRCVCVAGGREKTGGETCVIVSCGSAG
jgi:hypothetical protein